MKFHNLLTAINDLFLPIAYFIVAYLLTPLSVRTPTEQYFWNKPAFFFPKTHFSFLN